jgi:hypothetical protein
MAQALTPSHAHPRSGGGIFYAHTRGVATSTAALVLAHDDGQRRATHSHVHPRSGGGLYGVG